MFNSPEGLPMAIYYLLLISNATYLLAIARPHYYPIKAERFKKLVFEKPLLVILDSIACASFLVSTGLFVKVCLISDSGPMPFFIDLASLYVLSIVRNQVATALESEISKSTSA
jgi:hypothetical protein